MQLTLVPLVFLFTDPATPEIYTLSLHDALPISDVHDDTGVDLLPKLQVRLVSGSGSGKHCRARSSRSRLLLYLEFLDRKSTRLNSSHSQISYAVFCLKKKRNTAKTRRIRTSIRR